MTDTFEIVVPAQAGTQLINSPDPRLMKLPAIQRSWQTTPAKSLVMRGD